MNDSTQPNTLRVNIYGHEYTVKAVADPAYIAEVASYVDERMRETELNLPGVQSPIRVAILAAMSITDELFSERKRREDALGKLESKAIHLADKVEHILDTALYD